MYVYAMQKDNGCAGRGGETKEQREGSGIRIVLQGAGESRGVSALDRWNSSMFLNDFLIYRLRDGRGAGSSALLSAPHGHLVDRCCPDPVNGTAQTGTGVSLGPQD